MTPSHAYSGDEALVTFAFEGDAATISLESLKTEGPIWSEDFGIFVSSSDQPESFQTYREKIAGAQDLHDLVRAQTEQVIRAVAPGGGFLLSSSNSIHPGVKPEYYLAMLETARAIGRYPISGRNR